MGYCLNRLDEPIFMPGPKLMRPEFGIRQRLESCGEIGKLGKLLALGEFYEFGNFMHT